MKRIKDALFDWAKTNVTSSVRPAHQVRHPGKPRIVISFEKERQDIEAMWPPTAPRPKIGEYKEDLVEGNFVMQIKQTALDRMTDAHTKILYENARRLRLKIDETYKIR